MSLIKGIQLYAHPDIDLTEARIWLSNGTMTVDPSTHLGKSYVENAMLPAGPWRSPFPNEYRQLCTQQCSKDFSQSVYLVRIPEHILSPLHKLGVEQLQTNAERQGFVSQSAYSEAIAVVMDYLVLFHSSSLPLINTGLGLNPPNLETVTINPQQQRYIGLHLDSWDLMPLPQRHQSTNRICINLGQGDRYLLFINLTLMDMFHILNQGKLQPEGWWEQLEWGMTRYTLQRSSDAIDVSPPVLIQEFMRCYPSYPVVKVRVAPGEAYIAPTENMIHDGCSVGQGSMDIPLTFRGYIQIPHV